MDLENTKFRKYQKNIHNKCKFCGKDLNPIGLDYLYANISKDSIEYERCNCDKSKEYWNKIDSNIKRQNERDSFKEIIYKFYSQNYIGKRLK